MKRLLALGFLLRWLAALVLVFCTLDPTGASFYHWVVNGSEARVAPPMSDVICRRWSSLAEGDDAADHDDALDDRDCSGRAVAGGVVNAVVADADARGLDRCPKNGTAMAWVILFVFSSDPRHQSISWSHMRRRLTGQADIDEVDAK